jgi:hypothetical protein
MYKNSSFDHTNSNLQIWYMLVHDSNVRLFFSTLDHILSHHHCSFPILILNPWRIHTHYILQKPNLSFIHQH